MPSYTVQLSDSQDQSFFVHVNIPATSWAMPKGNAGSWRSLEEGYIKLKGGGMWWTEAAGTATGKHLLLLSPSGKTAFRLFDFKDLFGVNSGNSGVVVQAAVLAFEPGRIVWALNE